MALLNPSNTAWLGGIATSVDLSYVLPVQFSRGKTITSGLLAMFLVLASDTAFAQTTQTNLLPGVIATFTNGQKNDSIKLPNLALFVSKDHPPTVFLGPSDYTVEMHGLISVDLRGLYSFRAEVTGQLLLTINGNPVLEVSDTGDKLSEAGKTIRLNKGTNSIVAKFTPPKDQDAMLRVYWVPRQSLPSLIPNSALSHAPNAESKHAADLRKGRVLFAEFRCAKCHETSLKGMPELAMDAPALDDIGTRLNKEWLAKWIQNPSDHRAKVSMPRLLHGDGVAENAQKIAAFLTSKRSTDQNKPAAEKEEIEKGQRLFQSLHCGGCHNTPGSDEKDPERISLLHLREKFRPGALESFLLNPQAHYRWIRMPNFKLTLEEARNLTAFLNQKATEHKLPTESRSLEGGAELLAASGCLNCHSLQGQTTSLKAPSLSTLLKSNLESGCLNPAAPGKAPIFPLDADSLAQIRNFLRTEVESLSRDNSREFAARQTELLNCAGCHGKFEGFPQFDILGGKLRPEWSAKFIAGEIPHKPRPWLESRMPAFPAHAKEIAAGLTALHGRPPQSPPEPASDQEMIETGRKLISAVGGFSCVSCHAVGETSAPQVLESPGINFAHSGERLLKSWFHSWVMNPLAMDPTTKMPVYFDNEGRSQLTEIFEGDGPKQIDAMWQYLLLGSKMPPPLLQ